ncbi:MAG: hypothetical protein HGA80_07010 [Candidatus Omnitrophica bacterium]|nr:hypothetical protein [Candidatus Omnitrophota bacterium]
MIMRMSVCLAVSAVIFMLCAGGAGAEVRSSVQDRLASATLKSLSKAYLATADLEELKTRNITKLKAMDEEEYQERYALAYDTLKDLPDDLKQRYAITEHMTREQALAQISALDKQQIYEAIDQVPDELVARKLQEYFQQEDADNKDKNKNILSRVGDLWKEVTGELGRE